VCEKSADFAPSEQIWQSGRPCWACREEATSQGWTAPGDPYTCKREKNKVTLLLAIAAKQNCKSKTV